MTNINGPKSINKQENRKIVTINDSLLSRERRQKNFIYVKDEQGQEVIFEFKGQNIPGVLRINNKCYNSNGKWSHNKWELALNDNVEILNLCQDFGTSEWFTEKTWDLARKYIKEKLRNIDISDETINRMVRAYFPSYALHFDSQEEILKVSDETKEQISTLIESQNKLIQVREQKESEEKKIEELKEILANEIKIRETIEKIEALGKKRSNLEEKVRNRKTLSLEELRIEFNARKLDNEEK